MRLHLHSLKLAAAVVCLAGFAGSAQAQSNSMFGASSPMSGSNGLGTGTTGNTQMATSAFPTSAFGSNTQAGAMGGQQGAMGGQMGAMGGQQGAMGAAGQQAGMVGQRSTRLAGNAQSGQTTPGQQNMTNRQGQNRNNARRTTQNGNQTGQTGAGNQQQRTVRPQMVINFDHPVRTSVKTQSILTTRFSKLADKTQFAGVEVEVDGSSVVLRGEVASAKDSKLAMILARLEPGVRHVENKLTVADSPVPETE
jgi:hypothetical protein